MTPSPQSDQPSSPPRLAQYRLGQPGKRFVRHDKLNSEEALHNVALFIKATYSPRR